jgi:hypothetical protein
LTMARGADLLPGFETAGWEIALRFSPRPQGQDFDAVSGKLYTHRDRITARIFP